MEAITATALARPRFATALLGVCALLALTLAAIGTHATIPLLVGERSSEIGIRMALGAEKRTILASVLREGLALAGGGIAVGLVGALFARTRARDDALWRVGIRSAHVHERASDTGRRRFGCHMDPGLSSGFRQSSRHATTRLSIHGRIH